MAPLIPHGCLHVGLTVPRAGLHFLCVTSPSKSKKTLVLPPLRRIYCSLCISLVCLIYVNTDSAARGCKPNHFAGPTIGSIQRTLLSPKHPSSAQVTFRNQAQEFRSTKVPFTNAASRHRRGARLLCRHRCLVDQSLYYISMYVSSYFRWGCMSADEGAIPKSYRVTSVVVAGKNAPSHVCI